MAYFISNVMYIMSLGLTNYKVKDPFGNFIDLSYILMKNTNISNYGIPTIFKSNGVDVGSLFQPLITIMDLSTNTVFQPSACDSIYIYYTFDTVGTNTYGYNINNGNIGNLYYVAIGGGGGGGKGNGAGGGGGGAGAMLYGTLTGLTTSSTIYITVGEFGAGSELTTTKGAYGGQTDISFNTTHIIAGGGGGGGSNASSVKDGANGINGSSGSGACNGGSSSLGNSPGTSGGNAVVSGRGGGGGGAGSRGLGGGNTTQPGAGGNGLSLSNVLAGSSLNTVYCVGGSGGSVGSTSGTIPTTYGSGGGGIDGIGGASIANNGYKGAVILAYSILQ